MKEVELSGHKVSLYDSIDELPISRFHKYNRYLLIDAGIGSEIGDFDQHIERVVRYIRKRDNDSASKELENLRQNVFLVLSGQNIKHLSFACLIKSIDGKEVTDLSPDGLAKVLEAIGGASRGEVNDILSSVKKKIDEELGLYFPTLFDDVRTREFYDVMKRLTLNLLSQVAEGTDEEKREQAEALREQLVLFSKPKVFTGKDGIEVRHDKDFETMCLLITKETGRDAKGMNTLEYYNAYEYLKEKARKEQNKAR
jgi:hypothetical protein